MESFQFIDEAGNAQKRSAIIYPELIPAPGFGFGEKFFYSIDTQHFPLNTRRGVIANSATWITWRLGETKDPTEVIKALSPFIDGYSFNCHRIIEKEGTATVEAKKIEFGFKEIEEFRLPEAEGAALVTTNIFDRKGRLAKQVESISNGGRKYNEKRVKTAERALHLMRLLTSKPVSLEEIKRLMTFTVGGIQGNNATAFSNVDVKAYVIGVIKEGKMDLLIDAGPALRTDNPLIIKG